MPKNKTETTTPEVAASFDACDAALMDVAAQIMAALIGKLGVTKPTPGEADQVAAAALTYAVALVKRVRA